MYFHEENYYLTEYDFGGQMGLLITVFIPVNQTTQSSPCNIYIKSLLDTFSFLLLLTP